MENAKPGPDDFADASVDPERTEPENAFDTLHGYSDQDYHLDRERAEGAKHPSGEVDPNATIRDEPEAAGRDIPPENGRRAWFDPATGEVHGSGAGAGGGNSGEDFNSDPQAGSGS